MVDSTHLTLAERMDRQEKALGDLRNDTTKRFAEMRAHTNSEIEKLRVDVHGEFNSVNAKLDAISVAIDKTPPKRKLLGR